MSTIIKITYDEFVERFKPINSPFSPSTILVETFGKELNYVQKQKISNIWTLLAEHDTLWITNGLHFVNRLNYIMTKHDWTNDIEVEY